MDIKYIRDLDHNYLIIKAEQEARFFDEEQPVATYQPNRFAERMLCAHTPDGIIGFEIRSCNHESRLFYKTDSLLSLRNRTLSSKLSRQDMHALLQALAQAQESLGEYLLDADKLYLSLETVFTNPSTHKWYFLSYPYPHAEEGTLETFLAELIDVISTADDDAVSEAYALYEMAGRKHARMRDMLKELRQTYDVDADCSAPACMAQDFGDDENNEQVRKNKREYYEQAADSYDEDLIRASGSFYEKRLGSKKSRFWKKEKISEKRKEVEKEFDEKATNGSTEDCSERDKSYLITPLLFIVVLLIPVYIRKEYVLSEAANIACSVIMGLCAAGALGSLLLEKRAHHIEDEEEDEAEEYENEVNDYNGMRKRYEKDEGDFAWKGAGYENTKYEKKNSGRNNGESFSNKEFYAGSMGKTYNPYSKMFEKWKSDKAGETAEAAGKSVSKVARFEDEDEDDACTVLLTGTSVSRSPKLYGRNTAASTNILLENLPMTLGSLGGSVDYKLNDKSVSRMHACIGKNESGHIYLKDLGSTNGTYLNGRRLASNEERCLNSGDEVRFGALEFEYI